MRFEIQWAPRGCSKRVPVGLSDHTGGEMKKMKVLAAVSVLGLFIGTAPGLAQANFYQRETSAPSVGTLPGRLYDRWGRLLGRIMGKYIPGNPTMMVQNM